GNPFALFEAAEAARRYPILDESAIDYAFLSPEGGALFCQRIARDLAAWLTRNGATLRTGARVTALDAEAGRATLESGETLSADRVAVTAGAWVLKLFPGLAETLTTYHTYVAYLEPPADLNEAWKSAPALLDIGGDADVYAIPPLDGTGLKLGSGLVKSRGGPDERRTPEPGEGERLRDLFAPPVARIAEYRVSRVVTCAYTFTADERFVCHAKRKALVVSACSGHGYKFGAAIGRRVAAAVESGDTDLLARWLAADDWIAA
ncbi:MAG: FAD-dependent oxidoreductase, partial [Geminicoccales bacterium]